MENMRYWLVTDAGRPAPWHVVTSEAVADEFRADDAARVEGPFVRADAYQGAVSDREVAIKALSKIAAGPNDNPAAEPWSKAEALIALNRLGGQ